MGFNGPDWESQFCHLLTHVDELVNPPGLGFFLLPRFSPPQDLALSVLTLIYLTMRLGVSCPTEGRYVPGNIFNI